MEYIKKEELIEGEIYKCNADPFGNYIMKAIGNLINSYNSVSLKNNWYNRDSTFGLDIGLQSKFTFELATSEEKHWLNSCIIADKFITFEEAMKTFIPEYVELINTDCRINCNIPAGKIYKCSKDVTKTYHFGFFLDSKYRIGFNKNEFNQYLKPSTKEAYDAQFIVKEPEFVLPEKWYLRFKTEDIFNKLCQKYREDFIFYSDAGITNGETAIKLGDYYYLGKLSKFGDEITFEQFKKYVLKEETDIEFGNKVDKEIIEPLPQFKIIETIETITKVENNEGSLFMIGDTITPFEGFNKGNKFKISGFRYNNAKTNICAITDTHIPNGIGIDKIEHFVEVKESNLDIHLKSIPEYKGIRRSAIITESLLEKAKRLYPIGTKFIPTQRGSRYADTSNGKFKEINGNIFHYPTNVSVYFNGKWAEIVEYPHGFKIGDKIKLKYGNDIWSITKIEGNQLFFETSYLPKINSILAKNAIKVN